jgi:hypothetical protein
MAANKLFEQAYRLSVVPTNGAQTSGAPGRYGGLTGVALNNVLTDTTVSMDFGPASWNLLVDAHVNGGGGSAIAVGDSIFYTDALTNATHLSKDVAGYFFGYALQANAGAGTATTIAVLHVPGGGLLSAGAIGSTQLAAGAVLTGKIAANNITAGLLTTTLAKGIIQLPLDQWNIIAANAIDSKANNAGLPAVDTTPLLERVNAATDKQQRLRWAAAGVSEIAFGGIISPPDLDNTQPVVFNMYAAMGGATDHPASAVSFFEGVGGSNIGGNLPAMAGGTTPAIYTLNCTAVATAAAPLPWSIGFTPAAHGADTLLVYAAWLTYTRK